LIPPRNSPRGLPVLLGLLGFGCVGLDRPSSLTDAGAMVADRPPATEVASPPSDAQASPDDVPVADVAPRSAGASCANASECASGFCVGGICCTNGNSCVLTGLALHWKLDETSGTVVRDSSGNRLDGTCVGTTASPTPSMLVPALLTSNPRSRAFAKADQQAVTLETAPRVPAARQQLHGECVVPHHGAW
jgi:hypothetical protein